MFAGAGACSSTISVPQRWLGSGEPRLDRGVVGEAQGAPVERQLAPLRRPGGRRLEHLEAAARAGGRSPSAPVGAARPKSSRSRSKTPGRSAGRRLRSPPKISGASPAHSVAARAARSTSSLASSGRSLVACRLAMQTPEAVRVKAIARRSGAPSWIASSRRSAIPPSRPGTRTRVRFEPPSPEAIRSGFWRASSARSGPSELREVSTRWHSAAQARASGAAKRGGHSCSRATSQAAPASSVANSALRSRLTWTWVSLRSSIRSSRERQVRSAGSGGKSRPWKRFQAIAVNSTARSIRALDSATSSPAKSSAPSSSASCSTARSS